MIKFLRQLWCRFRGHQEYIDVNCPTPPGWHKPKWVCKCCGKEYVVPNKEVGIDEMTPEMYNSMSPPERFLWARWWNCQGHISFRCLRCGFPTATGQVGCRACIPGWGNGAEE